MSTRISDESLLLSKYLANNSNKTAEVEKTATSTTTSGKTTSNTAGSKYDSLLLSSQADPYVYNTYNSSGEYEATPSLIDYMDDGDKSKSSSLFGSSSSDSDSDALKLLGAAGGNTVSLVDFLDSGNSSSTSDGYSSYFSQMSEASATKTNALIQQALEKIQEKESSSSKKTDKTTAV